MFLCNHGGPPPFVDKGVLFILFPSCRNRDLSFRSQTRSPSCSWCARAFVKVEIISIMLGPPLFPHVFIIFFFMNPLVPQFLEPCCHCLPDGASFVCPGAQTLFFFSPIFPMDKSPTVFGTSVAVLHHIFLSFPPSFIFVYWFVRGRFFSRTPLSFGRRNC